MTGLPQNRRMIAALSPLLHGDRPQWLACRQVRQSTQRSGTALRLHATLKLRLGRMTLLECFTALAQG